MDLDLIAKILKEEARKINDFPNTYCTIELRDNVLVLVLREPIQYEGDMDTNLGPLQDFINEYKNR